MLQSLSPSVPLCLYLFIMERSGSSLSSSQGLHLDRVCLENLSRGYLNNFSIYIERNRLTEENQLVQYHHGILWQIYKWGHVFWFCTGFLLTPTNCASQSPQVRLSWSAAWRDFRGVVLVVWNTCPLFTLVGYRGGGSKLLTDAGAECGKALRFRDPGTTYLDVTKPRGSPVCGQDKLLF